MSNKHPNADEAKFQKLFNDGYIIGVHDNVLAETLSQIESKNTWFEGFIKGLQQGLRERDKSIYRAKELSRMRDRGAYRDREIDL